MKFFTLIFILLSAAYSQDYVTPQTLGASFVKDKSINTIQIGTFLKTSSHKTATASRYTDSDPSLGASFIPVAFDDNLGINQLSKSITKKHLNRSLFGEPQYAATYYYTEFDRRSNLLENTYIQFVSDSQWDRVLYGSLNGSIEKYTTIKNPGEIAISSAGQVFIADRGNSRIQVLKINGKNESVSLQHLYNIDHLGSVSAIAFNDGGTPFIMDDDYLCVADASANAIYQFNLNDNTARKINTFTDFRWPSSLIFGRQKGANTNELYVIDNYSKRITLCYLTEEEIIKKVTLSGQASQTFSSIEVDYFGHLFIADNVNNEITKYTSELVFLDAHQSANKGFSDLNIPFGTVKFYDEQKYWVGFDQLIAIQNWTEYSGVQRYKLSTNIRGFTVDVSEDNKFVNSKFTLTDFSNAKLRIKKGATSVYESPGFQIASGQQSINWDRRSNDNQQAAAGNYTLQVEFESAYDESIQTKSVSLYLPLYYIVNCGDEDDTKAIRRIKGKTAIYNGLKVIEDNEYVAYKIVGLNPQSQYEIALEYSYGNGNSRYQNLVIDGEEVQEMVFVNEKQIITGWSTISANSYSDGKINIEVTNPDGGEVTVSNIWIKESGQHFAINTTENELPTEYLLGQNYPNPFNPTTKIKFHLPLASNVRLSVYDVVGRKISELINETRDVGVHTVEFEGSELASGIYFYRLEAGSYKQVKRMLIIK